MESNMSALTHQQAENLASSVRTSYWCEDRFPVDPVSIGREMGTRIVDAQLPEDVSGAILKKVGQTPIIMLNESEPYNRRRFTCAHELGHFVYRLERGHFDDQEIDHVDYRDGKAAAGECSEEVSANRFAAALLMPKAKVKELKKKSFDLFAMATFFKVSPTAMGIRLEGLGLK